MGVMACEKCGKLLSNNTISIGNSYIRLCDECYCEIKHMTIEELNDEKDD